MVKQKMTVTMAQEILADVDADAKADGLNRSEYVERVLRQEHYRRMFATTGVELSSEDEALARRGLAEQHRDLA